MYYCWLELIKRFLKFLKDDGIVDQNPHSDFAANEHYKTMHVGMYVKSLHLAPTLCDPMDYSMPGSSVLVIL